MAKDILGKTDAQKALIIQKRLLDDYLPFFENIQGYYKETAPDEAEAKLCAKIVSHIKRANKLISRVFLGVGVTAATKRELEQLNQLLEEIEVGKLYLTKRAPDDSAMSKFLDMTEQKTGISREDLDMSVALTRKAKKEFGDRQRGGRGGIGSYIGTGLSAIGLGPKRMIAGAGIAQVLAPLLGPYWALIPAAYIAANIATKTGILAYKGIRSLFQHRPRFRGRKRADGGNFFSSLIKPNPAVNLLSGLSGLRPAENIAPPAPADFTPATPETSFLQRPAKKATTKQLVEPLWIFFNNFAYKAKWTRELLKTFKDKKLKPASERFAGFGQRKDGKRAVGKKDSLVKTVLAATGLSMLIPGAAVVGAAAGAAVNTAGKGFLAGVAAITKYATALGAFIALYQIPHKGPQGPPTKVSQALSEFTGIGKPEHKFVGRTSALDKQGPIPEQPAFFRYFGLGPAEGKRTLIKDAKVLVETIRKDPKLIFGPSTAMGKMIVETIRKDPKLIFGPSTAMGKMKDTGEWALWPAFKNLLKYGKTPRAMYEERKARELEIGKPFGERLAGSKVEMILHPAEPNTPEIILTFPQLDELKNIGKLDAEILKTLNTINDSVKNSNKPALGHVPVGGIYQSADPNVSNINTNGVD